MGIHSPLSRVLWLLLLNVLMVRSSSYHRCGKRSVTLLPRGITPFRGEYPWHVAIYIDGQDSTDNTFHYICDGSIISPNFVLTAAHCVVNDDIPDLWTKPELFYFRAGVNDLKNEAEGSSYNVSEIIVHPRFNMATYSNDIALLRSTGDISLADPTSISPICLPPPVKGATDVTFQELLNRSGIGAGWEITKSEQRNQILKSFHIAAIERDSCRSNISESIQLFLHNDEMFCARRGSNETVFGENLCSSYSGGGLVYNQDEVYYLRGIASIIPRKDSPDDIESCAPYDIVIYTDVARYTEWIAEQQRNAALRNLLNVDDCGIDPNESIKVETEKPIFNQYPWNALLEVYRKNDEIPLFPCGGVLIHTRFVLTVGNCVTGIPRNFTLKSVRLGEFKLFYPEDTMDGLSITHQSIPIKRIIRNRNYNRPRNSNNLALLELEYDADTSKPNIKLICLPNRMDYVQTGLTLTGWKRNWIVFPTLSRNTVNWTPSEECRSQYSEKGVELPETSAIVYGTFVETPEGNCNNYGAGSALQYIKHSDGKRRYFLAGLLTFNFPACLAKRCQMFVPAWQNGSWIQQEVHYIRK